MLKTSRISTITKMITSIFNSKLHNSDLVHLIVENYKFYDYLGQVRLSKG